MKDRKCISQDSQVRALEMLPVWDLEQVRGEMTRGWVMDR